LPNSNQLEFNTEQPSNSNRLEFEKILSPQESITNFTLLANAIQHLENRTWRNIKAECAALYCLSVAFHKEDARENPHSKKRRRTNNEYTLHPKAKEEYYKQYNKKSSSCA
jgi:hypothetical protein